MFHVYSIFYSPLFGRFNVFGESVANGLLQLLHQWRVLDGLGGGRWPGRQAPGRPVTGRDGLLDAGRQGGVQTGPVHGLFGQLLQTLVNWRVGHGGRGHRVLRRALRQANRRRCPRETGHQLRGPAARAVHLNDHHRRHRLGPTLQRHRPATHGRARRHRRCCR